MMRRRREADAKVAMIAPHSLKTVRLCCIKEALINEEQITAESKGLEHIRGPNFCSLRRRGVPKDFQSHVSIVARCLHDPLRHDCHWPSAPQPFFNGQSQLVYCELESASVKNNLSTIWLELLDHPPSLDCNFPLHISPFDYTLCVLYIIVVTSFCLQG